MIKYLPEGIFEGIPEWDGLEKTRKVREWLRGMPVERLFRRGMPRRRPAGGYLHSTCGCWQCGYCHGVILRRALQSERRERWVLPAEERGAGE